MTSEAADCAKGVGDVLEQRTRDLTASADRASARAEEYVHRLGSRAEELTKAADYTDQMSKESAERIDLRREQLESLTTDITATVSMADEALKKSSSALIEASEDTGDTLESTEDAEAPEPETTPAAEQVA